MPEGLELSADRARLDQALDNLLDNALRHGAGAVRLWAEADSSAVRLHVADNGDGFPPGFASAAFDRFARGDAGRSEGGAGLGLSIVQAIARAHGGWAEARESGPGAEVWLTLARQPSEDNGERGSSSATSPSAAGRLDAGVRLRRGAPAHRPS